MVQALVDAAGRPRRLLQTEHTLEHLQQAPNAPRAKDSFAVRLSSGLAWRAALAPAAAQDAARAPFQQRTKMQHARSFNIFGSIDNKIIKNDKLHR
mgnify:CR=1 FL=1